MPPSSCIRSTAETANDGAFPLARKNHAVNEAARRLRVRRSLNSRLRASLRTFLKKGCKNSVLKFPFKKSSRMVWRSRADSAAFWDKNSQQYLTILLFKNRL